MKDPYAELKKEVQAAHDKALEVAAEHLFGVANDDDRKRLADTLALHAKTLASELASVNEEYARRAVESGGFS